MPPSVLSRAAVPDPNSFTAAPRADRIYLQNHAGEEEMTNSLAPPIQARGTNLTQRTVALIAGISLLILAVLAAFAQFGVLQALIVPADAETTVDNLVASNGLFRVGILAFLIVILLDVVVAWALYVLLRPASAGVALLAGWMRLAYTAVFAVAVANLLDVAQLLGGGQASPLAPEQLQAQVTASIASFNSGWDIGLAIFALHLLGIGFLLWKSAHFPRFLGVLVATAGGGYLADSVGTVLVTDYSLTISVFTFVGEALLIPWLLWKAIRGFPATADDPGAVEPHLAQPAAVA